ncbi:MAG: hypothetical protein EB144_01695 [Actinobacteria bacterium]|nr:hypothetical protein [Actinomycetota bacterium]
MANQIVVRGAREHNLKNISVELPRDKLIVLTGLSGSGKSSLAFDTIYAEGQRRYVESLSSYARQFLGQMDKPDVDLIDGLSPAISIDQKSSSRNPRSTVGTITEVYDYLRLLYARIGVQHCSRDMTRLSRQTPQQIVDRIMKFEEGVRFQILAPVVRGRKGEYDTLLQELASQGFSRARVDGEVVEISEFLKKPTRLAKYEQHQIDIVVDRLVRRDGITRRLTDSLETALRLANGVAEIEIVDGGEPITFSQHLACPKCGTSYEELAPRNFSFNSPFGACDNCLGLGTKYEVDVDLVVPDPNLSINEGAIAPWRSAHTQYFTRMLEAVADRFDIDLDKKWSKLSVKAQKIVMNGVDDNMMVKYRNRYGRTREYSTSYEGVIPWIKRRHEGAESDNAREQFESYMREVPCPSCKGARLKPDSLAVLVEGKHISEVCGMSIGESAKFLADLELSDRDSMIAERITKEINSRLGFLLDVGLDYLTLSRAAATLAGGEAQRIRLASQIGSGLVREHNLKNLNVKIPLGCFVAVTGVSGSGKSTLIRDILLPSLMQKIYKSKDAPGRHTGVDGVMHIDKVIDMDQSPIGRTPRSNPATYTGVFDDIRKLFASTPEAKVRGYQPGRFSFNVPGGRCEACSGDGTIKIEMHFLPDVYVPCEVCKGARYNRDTLDITFKGKSIADILDMPIGDAVDFFANQPRIARHMQTFVDVGLGYVRLGQSAPTLSGGEAQRVKLASELSKRGTGRTMYLLDEPTTGLHFEDVRRLLIVLARLVDSGNTVLVIEHNLDVIKSADWVIDLGPEGGSGGGLVVAEGSPEDVAKVKGSHTGKYLSSVLNESKTMNPKKIAKK